MHLCLISFLTCFAFVLLFPGSGDAINKALIDPFSRSVQLPVRKCEVGYDMLVLPGSKWTEGCRSCRCDQDAGKICEGPVCPKPYHPSHEDHCIQWSADKCCCEKVGCLSYGVAYNFGDVYPRTRDFCEECMCEGGHVPEKCWRKHCTLQCVDGKHIQGQCCMECVNGENCSIPPLRGVNIYNNVATKTPLPVNGTRLVYSRTRPGLFYLCVCVIPGEVSMCFPNMAL